MVKQRLVRLLAGSKRYIYIQIWWQWVALVSQIIGVYFIAKLLESYLSGSGAVQEALIAGTVCMPVLAVRAIASREAVRCSFFASRDVKIFLREQLYQKLLRLGASYKEHTATAEAVQLATEGVEQLELYFGRYLPQFFYSLLAPLTLFAVLAFFSIKSASVLLICVPLIPLSIIAVQKIAKRLLKKYWGIYTGLGGSFLENLQGLTTLKIYRADAQKAAEMARDAEHFRRVTMKVLTMQLNSVTVMDLIAYGGAAAGISTALFEYAAGIISLSSAIMIILLAAEFFIPLRLLGSFFHIAMNGMAASDKMFYILDLPEQKHYCERIDPVCMQSDTPCTRHQIISTLHAESCITGSICINNLSFSYTPERPVIRSIHAHIPQGSFIFIAGSSGCGKSTLVRLLTGKYTAYSGDIVLGGHNIRNISENTLMRSIVTIKHDSVLFKGTVAENLKMAKPDASVEEMLAVLKKVRLYTFLQTQCGLETPLLEYGSNFSGGQRQRLALARALLFDSAVYIFDEAASNIDVESETHIMEVIAKLKLTKTVILISHRLANAVSADTIYFMEQGQITEEGTHAQLCALKGGYARLFESQQELEHYGEHIQ